MLGREDHIIESFPLDKLPEGIFTLPRVNKFLLPA
jgi:hypothetical protein